MTSDEIEAVLVRLAGEVARMRKRLDGFVDELTGIRRRLTELDGHGEDGTRIGLPPPPSMPTRTDPYLISEMDDEPTRREKRPL